MLTLRELSARIGVREGTLRVWKLRGMGPQAHKLGPAVFYYLADVEAWEREQEAESA